jgi:type II secretory pathway pseudopilin PulG
MRRPTLAADPARADGGFALVEVVVCVALLVAACGAALSVLPGLIRASQRDLLRDAAMNLGTAAIERVRAATAYDPPTGAAPNHVYALRATASYTASAHVHRALCGGAQPATDVPMNVRMAYDAAADDVTVTVDYPRNACDPSVREKVVLGAQLAPSALVPGTTIITPIDDPATQ